MLDYYYFMVSEMCYLSSASFDVSSLKAFDGVAMSDDVEDLCLMFWVVLFEVGGLFLLLFFNIIYCVFIVCDCVMCEECRFSLAYMDEVLYF